MAGDVGAGASLRAGGLPGRQRIRAGTSHGAGNAERLAAASFRDASEGALVVARARSIVRIARRRVAAGAAAGTSAVGPHPFVVHALGGLGGGGRSRLVRCGRRGGLLLRLRGGGGSGLCRLRGGLRGRGRGLRALRGRGAGREGEKRAGQADKGFHGANLRAEPGPSRRIAPQPWIARARLGSTTQNVVPSLCEERTEIEPSCARTICCTM
jgi:hypothetical protein